MRVISYGAAVARAADAMQARADAAEPIRLLYLRDTTIVCGPGKTIINTWRTLDIDRFALTIASTRPPAGSRNALLDRAASFQAPTLTFDIGAGVDWRAARRLARVLRTGGFDILQTHDSQTRRLGVIAARLAGVAHVTSVHGWIFNTRKERAARWLDQRLIRLADHVIAISDRLKQEVMQGGTPAERITVLHNAVLLEDYTRRGQGEALRRELGIPAGNAVLSIIGRLSPEKGHRVFFEAAKILSRTHDNLTFLVVGDGPLRASLEEEARQLGLERSVVFAGHRTDMAAVYDATTLVVSSSFTEGVPNVLLEGFAYGRPAVATSVGGVPEIMSNGVEGWLIEPHDASALADRIDTVLGTPGALAEMGERARATIDRKFDFRRRTRELEAIYDRIADRFARQPHRRVDQR
jgi:glycosyltransferase involved in cell wall biosynthesis